MVESSLKAADVAKKLSDALSGELEKIQGNLPGKSGKLQELLPEKRTAVTEEPKAAKNIQLAHRVGSNNQIGTRVFWEA